MITQVILLKPGDFVQTNEKEKKYMIVESCDSDNGFVTCIWYNAEMGNFERISIFAEDLDLVEPEQ